jgi:hypothetical protein
MKSSYQRLSKLSSLILALPFFLHGCAREKKAEVKIQTASSCPETNFSATQHSLPPQVALTAPREERVLHMKVPCQQEIYYVTPEYSEPTCYYESYYPCSPRFIITLDTGYRWDRLYNRINLFGENFGGTAASQTQSINSYQLGGKGLWQMFSTAYIRGQGHYGWVFSGNYIEAKTQGDLEGNTWDATAGLGFGFYLHPFWKIAPIIGWSYDKLNLTATHVTAADFIAGDIVPIGDIDLTSTFQGPWIGVDLFFQASDCFDLNCGYELHRARWKEQRLLTGEDLNTNFGVTTGFSNERTQEPVWGHIFQLDGICYFCDCWNIGLGLKYQVWQGQNMGKHERLFTPVDPDITNQVVADTQWDSFSATFRLGLGF